MELPWLWMILMTIAEVIYGAYKIQKGGSGDTAFGIIFGIWMLALVIYMDAHLIWN
jgi:hypothetical protein